MLDLEEAIDPARLSSTSPSSDSMDMPRLVAAVAVEESTETRSGRPEFDPEAAEFSGSRLRPTEDSFKNCSKKDIWLLGRSPMTAKSKEKTHENTSLLNEIKNIQNCLINKSNKSADQSIKSAVDNVKDCQLFIFCSQLIVLTTATPNYCM